MPSPIAFDLMNRVALITGATSGFGMRFAQVLSDAGAHVVITGRRVERLSALKHALEIKGGRATALALDVTDVDQIRSCVADAENRAGPIDILINNAGINVQSPVGTLEEADYDKLMGTNVKGAFFMAQAVGRRMAERKAHGRIVNIASIGAFKALPGLVAYSMSKAAISMMTKGLAREWARHHIAVNAICPGFIKTELNEEWFETEGGQKQVMGFPRRRLGQEENLDALLLLLCSQHADFITGSLFTVDDGQLLA
ncbi:MAG: glucose 1-dehydrogenase [Alphaproteobacteria bacterium]|nr:glucose 1-dehydrogenase [Alphaproteobacteria bacterium]